MRPGSGSFSGKDVCSIRICIVRKLLVVTVTFLFTPVSLAHAQSDQARCEKTKQEIRLVQSKMRAGYTRAQGEKLEARLRKLRAERAKVCR